VPNTKQQEELVKVIGQRLREIPELDATQVLPARFEQHLQMLRQAESEKGEAGRRAVALQVGEPSS
jgi:hypothetical protein